MKYFYLITNEVKDPEGFYTRKITAYLAAHGGKVVCTEHAASYPKLCKPDLAKPEVPDCILVLGGDGTLLRAARNLLNQDIPLLGINLGTLGYLAEVEIAAIEEALDKLLADRFTREERMMLEGQVRRQDMAEQNYALNDIVISRCGSLQVLTFQIYVNGQFLNSYSADGMIVATPTGSTGYNMSAGGPIVEPGASLLLLTPICPHTLNTRSIVLAPDDEIRIEIPRGKDGQRQTVEASYDGSHKVRLQTDDSIVIRRADKTTGILKLNTESFLTVLHKKMSE
ncbi:MAG: NAD(+)/NADH kinase [Lachnospiraceae bacterium]|jgi:NAD+ kinase|nr:NAD(+)/NADH kinase [Lachnospiraceae bacterium]